MLAAARIWYRCRIMHADMSLSEFTSAAPEAFGVYPASSAEITCLPRR
jgi:hypothetical protein